MYSYRHYFQDKFCNKFFRHVGLVCALSIFLDSYAISFPLLLFLDKQRLGNCYVIKKYYRLISCSNIRRKEYKAQNQKK